jgi:hypothetical protein
VAPLNTATWFTTPPVIVPAPFAPEVPDVPGFPFAPEVPDVPGFPFAPEVPDVPGFPFAPDVPEVPGGPCGPCGPCSPFAPEVPEVPGFPFAPDVPEVPDGVTANDADTAKLEVPKNPTWLLRELVYEDAETLPWTCKFAPGTAVLIPTKPLLVAYKTVGWSMTPTLSSRLALKTLPVIVENGTGKPRLVVWPAG